MSIEKAIEALKVLDPGSVAEAEKELKKLEGDSFESYLRKMRGGKSWYSEVISTPNKLTGKLAKEMWVDL